MLRVTGALLLFFVETYPDPRQRQGCGYDFTFLQKRENDFTERGGTGVIVGFDKYKKIMDWVRRMAEGIL